METNSEDSEEDDVQLLLAPVAHMAAPTPAMPRIQNARPRKRLNPQTPTRTGNHLPTRANLSYLSPLPPDRSGTASSLRPQPLGGEKIGRGSILSWEQLASEASKTLGEDEVENMLSEFPAPFRSGAVSPSPSVAPTDIPESPCLSAMNSPGGYGSISQVLLPDVTPSPAMHSIQQRYEGSSEAPVVDAAIVTLLRLQLASAEHTAKERLYQVQAMEEELHSLKKARSRETVELTRQVAYMEDQFRGNLEARERSEEERAAYIASLEDQLRHAQGYREKAIEEATRRTREATREACEATIKMRHREWEVACCARVATSEWMSVRQLSESELDLVRADREVLLVLLGELDRMRCLMAQ